MLSSGVRNWAHGRKPTGSRRTNGSGKVRSRMEMPYEVHPEQVVVSQAVSRRDDDHEAAELRRQSGRPDEHEPALRSI